MGIYVFKKSLMLDLLDAVSESAGGSTETQPGSCSSSSCSSRKRCSSQRREHKQQVVASSVALLACSLLAPH